ncbi:unnamed protein product [Cuscuta europaea]|uniref:Uncharacterized protein n=1 Tax=Cuscuta europaea TaxID=41803 RepID=A0A9P0Z9A3_CUSEU|nr:unnamed protein product [Cuscuta europaea]
MQGVVRGHRSTSVPKKFLSEEYKSIQLIFFYDVVIDRKSWIYHLHEPAQWLDAMHVQVICFYLRMKAATYPYPEKFSTCCTYIPDYLNKMYDKYKVGVVHPEDSASDGYLVEETAGAEEIYMLPFWDCDRVYIPLNLFDTH